MKSRKDKLKEAALKQTEKILGSKEETITEGDMGNLIQQIKTDRDKSQSKGSEKTEIELPRDDNIRVASMKNKNMPSKNMPSLKNKDMPSSRDSIYNVSSNMRLEDYVEETQGTQSKKEFIKGIGIVVTVFFLFYLIYSLIAYTSVPDYSLAVANEYIVEDRMKELDQKTNLIVQSSLPVYIRFAWEDGKLETDYLRIAIYRQTKEGKKEEASLGRRKPLTANYVYFMGPLETGQYELQVLDRKGKQLQSKEFQVR